MPTAQARYEVVVVMVVVGGSSEGLKFPVVQAVQAAAPLHESAPLG